MTKKKAFGYCRVSTDEQAQEGLSLEHQKSRIRAYAESQNWELIEPLYIDAGFSAKNGDRPAYRQLIADLKAGKADILIVLKVDRATRRQKELLTLLEDILEPAGVGFTSIQEPFDTSTGIGKAFIGMVSVFAQLEGDMIAERTRAVLQDKRSKGFWCGRVPYGFKIKHGRLIEDPEQIKTIEKIKRMKRRGVSIRAISRAFSLSQGTVRNLLNEHLSSRKAKYLKRNGE